MHVLSDRANPPTFLLALGSRYDGDAEPEPDRTGQYELELGDE